MARLNMESQLVSLGAMKAVRETGKAIVSFTHQGGTWEMRLGAILDDGKVECTIYVHGRPHNGNKLPEKVAELIDARFKDGWLLSGDVPGLEVVPDGFVLDCGYSPKILARLSLTGLRGYGTRFLAGTTVYNTEGEAIEARSAGWAKEPKIARTYRSTVVLSARSFIDEYCE
jgi:hypothetical protein